jgi:6-methylsalicylate decarboxylase
MIRRRHPTRSPWAPYAKSIVFGTDFPFRTTSEHVKGLAASQTFSPDELRAIYRENAVRLLPQRAG